MNRYVLAVCSVVSTVFLAACVTATPPADPTLRISKIVIDMGPYLARTGAGAPVIEAELRKQASRVFAQYQGSPGDPVLILQVNAVDLRAGFSTTRGSRETGNDAIEGAAIVEGRSGRLVYPILTQIPANHVTEPQTVVAAFLGWTEKFVFGR